MTSRVSPRSRATKKKFKAYPLGYFHVDIAEVQTTEGKLYLFVAIDRTSKFAFVELHQKSGKMAAAAFLRNQIAAVPYRLHIVLTKNKEPRTKSQESRIKNQEPRIKNHEP